MNISTKLSCDSVTTDAASTRSQLAANIAVQKMDNELRCPACSRYFPCPILLPCGHSLCNSCAAGSLLPAYDTLVTTAIRKTLHLISQDSCNHSAIEKTFSSASSSTSGFSVQTTQVGLSPYNGATGCSNPDSDQISVLSETDSGLVVVTSRSVSQSNRLPLFTQHQPPQKFTQNSFTHGLLCPACKCIVGLFDEKGIEHLPKNKALERIVQRFVDPALLQTALCRVENDYPDLPQTSSLTSPLNRPGGPLCQMCENPTNNAIVATDWCEQCEIFYCKLCRETCHPSRGPLLRHALHSSSKGVEIIRQKRQTQPPPCNYHPEDTVPYYCSTCSVPVCYLCLQTIGSNINELHARHDVHPLNALSKSRKTELSQNLQSLSERARSATELIQRLRARSEEIKHQFSESEQYVINKLDSLSKQIENKKMELVAFLNEMRDKHTHELKAQINQVTGALTRSTGLIQFCIEMLKETDLSAFLLVSSSLISRAIEAEHQFVQDLDTVSVTNETEELQRKCFPLRLSVSNQVDDESPKLKQTESFTLQLDPVRIEKIRKEICELILQINLDKLELQSSSCSPEVSKHEKPSAPLFLPEECIAERNVFTVVWKPSDSIQIDRYTLEMDDGANGNFRKVYRGSRSICTVEGLHFRSIYRVRVKAHNESGESDYSPILHLRTSALTWFHLDSICAQPELLMSNCNRTVSSHSLEDRVILASTGLSRGVHYWEFVIDRCDPGGQPSFGIARQDCNKHIMLGLDMRSWAMYFDHKRSWFLHNGEHFERTDGGVRAGSVVGVRFDCDRGSLSFYLDDEPHGPIAFTNLPSAVYFPAVSLTRLVQLTLHSGLDAPSESEESDEDNGGRIVVELPSATVSDVRTPQSTPSH